MSIVTAAPPVAGADASPGEAQAAARQDLFVRAELVRRLFEGSAPSRYFAFVLWPVIAAMARIRDSLPPERISGAWTSQNSSRAPALATLHAGPLPGREGASIQFLSKKVRAIAAISGENAP